MDIRLWLQPKKTPKRKIEDDDDDDVIPESPDVQIKNKKKKPSSEAKTTKNKILCSKNAKPLKEVNVTDLFGNGPINRKEPIVKNIPKKSETGIHSDEEFEKSLLEIDGLEGETDKNDYHNLPEKLEDNHNKKVFKMNGAESDPNSRKDMKKSQDKIKLESKDFKSSMKLEETRGDKIKSVSPTKLNNKSSKAADAIKKEIRENKKRKFTEFIEDNKDSADTSKKKKLEEDADKIYNSSGETKPKITVDNSLDDEENDYDFTQKKQHKNKSLNESVLSDEERHERRRQSAALYQQYLNRSGPKHLGTKTMPEGAPNCLQDYAFLLTGVLDSFEKDEIAETIKKYGGSVKSGVSKKVTHVLAGDEPGPAKMAKAQELGIKIIHEDDFLKIIEDSLKTKEKTEPKKEKLDRDSKKDVNSYKKSHNRKIGGVTNKIDKEEKDIKKGSEHKHNSSENRIEKLDNDELEQKESKNPNLSQSKNKLKIGDNSNNDRHRFKSKSPKKDNHVLRIDGKRKSESESKSTASLDSIKDNSGVTKINENTSESIAVASSTMWVEKYKPQTVKQIIGQQGDASNVNKLINWLTKWYVNRKAKLPKPSPWAKNDDGGFYKAALLSGPPGVGKTTTVALVCKQLGFDMVEFNASDTRNKTLIKEQIGELLTTTTLSGYAKGDTGKQAVSKKHVLVMDEVDGMAGNEDRGGLQELIGLIKNTSVPIICMCNDRNSQKMRSLVNYCYDLRFNRPKVEQIKAAMRSICCKENIKIPPDVLGQLILSANQDVRQTLNLLSMWAIDPTRMDPDRLSKDAAVTKKDVKMGPWEAVRKVFSAEEHKTMTVNDKSDLFFSDYSLMPLFVQENYLQVQPHCPKGEVLDRISKAAESIAFSDTIDSRIRGNQAWSLLTMHAMYSSVLPGHYMSGHVAGQIQFPGWLGKNSRTNKMHRLCQEIHAHTRLSTTGSKSSIFLDYAPHIRDAIVNPLIKQKMDGIDTSLEVMDSYHLLREDLDSLTELSIWPGQRNPTVLIDSKVKAAMTRSYNKKSTALPYAPATFKRVKRDDEEFGEEDVPDDTNDDSDPENDALIKKKKTKEHKDAADEKPSTSKGKSSDKGASKKKKKS